MTVQEAIRTRRSVRSYLDRAVEPEVLQTVMEAARRAPSARNDQEWRFIVVTDAEKRRQIGDAANGQRFVAEAPVVVVGCAETDRRLMACGHPAYLIDVAIAMDHLSLAATEAGLGTCWVGSFNAARVRSILGIPPGVQVVELMPLGYPSDPAPVRKKRLDYAVVIRHDGWQES